GGSINMISTWGGCFSILKPALLPLVAGGPTGPVETRGLLYFGILVLATGLVSIVYPRFFWNIGVGRKAKIPPPRAYLMMLRVGGILACGLGAIMLLKVYQM
ncbi:MAG TPA: hypothetical protein PLY40_06150, partial [Bacillota bacterium]|nr:hypothetical protein [Bacillota bacterium]